MQHLNKLYFQSAPIFINATHAPVYINALHMHQDILIYLVSLIIARFQYKTNNLKSPLGILHIAKYLKNEVRCSQLLSNNFVLKSSKSKVNSDLVKTKVE